MSEQDVGPQYQGESGRLTGQSQSALTYTPQKRSKPVFRPAQLDWHTREVDTEGFTTHLIDKREDLA